MNLDQLYDRYGEQMYHYLALRLGSREDAEDALQETFFRLARISFRWPFIRNPKAFVFKILRNEANRSLGRRISRRREERNDPEAIQDAAAAAPYAQRDERTIILEKALGLLPEDQKEIIILKAYQDFTFKEIASLCGISINTAASRYRYGIEKLRSALEEKI
jgi:RNA polymerase sigma-70 factor (ECF subfamily)